MKTIHTYTNKHISDDAGDNYNVYFQFPLVMSQIAYKIGLRRLIIEDDARMQLMCIYINRGNAKYV